MRPYLLGIVRIFFVVSPVLLAVSTKAPAAVVSTGWYWPVVVLIGFTSIIAGINSAATETPTAWLFEGFRAFYRRGSKAMQRAEHLVARSTTTVKILDTYWEIGRAHV